MNPQWISPGWAAPPNVRALSTTRAGGFSAPPWSSLNLGLNCGDAASAVLKNRSVLRACLPAEPTWLAQAHGIDVYRHPAPRHIPLPGDQGLVRLSASDEPIADAQVAGQPGQVCVVLTADCLPVLFCNRSGTRVAAAHAGWRGMLAGVLEQTLRAMGEEPAQLMAWLGPAIGASAYEVGDELRQAFMREDAAAAACFSKKGRRWLFDLYAMARFRLEKAGLSEVTGGTYCTYSDPDRFFSYRRDGVTGRMASLVWLEG